MANVFWEQIKDGLPNAGKYLTGSLGVTGSVSIEGTLFIDGTDILDLISGGSEIFAPTGSYWSTTNDLQITGSLYIDLDDSTKEFIISVSGSDKVKVNNQGVFQLVSQSTTPIAVPGGIYYNSTDEFYFGFNS